MTVKTKYTKKLLLNFQKFNRFKSKAAVAVYVITELVMLALAAVYIITSESTLEYILSLALITPVFVLALPLVLIINPYTATRLNKHLIDCETTYEFSESELVVSSNMPAFVGETRANYNFFYRVFECDDAFYLYISQNQSFIIDKTALTKEEISEIQTLLKTKLTHDKYVLKTKSSILVPILAAVVALTVTAAAFYAYLNPYTDKAKEKTFSSKGLNITLTEDFTEKDHVSFTTTFVSENVAVCVLKEEFELFDNPDISLTEYAELLIEGNELDSKIEETDGLTTFTYETNFNGNNHSYLSVVYKGDDAFWFIQFGCLKKDAERLMPTLLDFARSVNVN